MEGNYSRYQLLEWANTTFLLKMEKVEQVASGAVFLQILDYLFPDVIPMHKVKWNVSRDYEYIHNFKLLQAAFDKLSIGKHVEVDKLIKGKYQDNLEFFQWMKSFFDRQIGKGIPEYMGYDPQERRRISGDVMPFWARTDPAHSNIGSGVNAKQPAQKNSLPPAKFSKENSLYTANDRKICSEVYATPQKNALFPSRKTVEGEISLSDASHHDISIGKFAPNASSATSRPLPSQTLGEPNLLRTARVASQKTGTSAASLKKLDNDAEAHSIVKTSLENTQRASMSASKHTLEASFKGFPTVESNSAHDPNFTTDTKSEAISLLEYRIESLKQELNDEKSQREKVTNLLKRYEDETLQLDLTTKAYMECKEERDTILLEKEFYYNKLRQLEIMCEDQNAMIPARNVLAVLYATEPILTEAVEESDTKSDASAKDHVENIERTGE